jgi:hypothetical protein
VGCAGLQGAVAQASPIVWLWIVCEPVSLGNLELLLLIWGMLLG